MSIFSTHVQMSHFQNISDIADQWSQSTDGWELLEDMDPGPRVVWSLRLPRAAWVLKAWNAAQVLDSVGTSVGSRCLWSFSLWT